MVFYHYQQATFNNSVYKMHCFWDIHLHRWRGFTHNSSS